MKKNNIETRPPNATRVTAHRRELQRAARAEIAAHTEAAAITCEYCGLPYPPLSGRVTPPIAAIFGLILDHALDCPGMRPLWNASRPPRSAQ